MTLLERPGLFVCCFSTSWHVPANTWAELRFSIQITKHPWLPDAAPSQQWHAGFCAQPPGSAATAAAPCGCSPTATGAERSTKGRDQTAEALPLFGIQGKNELTP